MRGPAFPDGACARSGAQDGIDAACAGSQRREGAKGMVVERMFDDYVSCEAAAAVKSAIWLAPPTPGTTGPTSSRASR